MKQILVSVFNFWWTTFYKTALFCPFVIKRTLETLTPILRLLDWRSTETILFHNDKDPNPIVPNKKPGTPDIWLPRTIRAWKIEKCENIFDKNYFLFCNAFNGSLQKQWKIGLMSDQSLSLEMIRMESLSLKGGVKRNMKPGVWPTLREV